MIWQIQKTLKRYRIDPLDWDEIDERLDNKTCFENFIRKKLWNKKDEESMG